MIARLTKMGLGSTKEGFAPTLEPDKQEAPLAEIAESRSLPSGTISQLLISEMQRAAVWAYLLRLPSDALPAADWALSARSVTGKMVFIG